MLSNLRDTNTAIKLGDTATQFGKRIYLRQIGKGLKCGTMRDAERATEKWNYGR